MGGYSGADCSGRMCKYGIDPLYVDDESTARVASSTYIVRPGFDGLQGTYAIKFYVATKASDMISEYAIFTTDGVAERVYLDNNMDSAYNATETAATAYFTQFTNDNC